MFKKKKKAVTPVEVPEDELGLLEAIAIRGGEITFGAPTRCPACGDFGFVEAVAAGVQRNRCMACGEVWQFSKRGLELWRFADGVRSEGPTVVGKGTLVNTHNVSGLARMTRESFVSMRDALRHTWSHKRE
jgi:hypothetical protein